eukprot:4812169-Alexandrium_andersonii.AAC.1
MAQNAPLEGFRESFSGRSWARPVPGSNAWSHCSMFNRRWRYSVGSVRFATGFDRYSVYVSSRTSLGTRQGSGTS